MASDPKSMEEFLSDRIPLYSCTYKIKWESYGGIALTRWPNTILLCGRITLGSLQKRCKASLLSEWWLTNLDVSNSRHRVCFADVFWLGVAWRPSKKSLSPNWHPTTFCTALLLTRTHRTLVKCSELYTRNGVLFQTHPQIMSSPLIFQLWKQYLKSCWGWNQKSMQITSIWSIISHFVSWC